MDRSIGGSRFHCGCARCFSGPRRTRNWTTSCGATSNEKPRNTSRCSVGGTQPDMRFQSLVAFDPPSQNPVGVVRHSPNNPGTFSWLSMPNAVDLVFAGEGA